MYRRFILILFAAITLLSLASCGPKEELTVLAGSELKDVERNDRIMSKIRSCAKVDLKFNYIGTLDGAERLHSASGEQTYDLAWFSHAKYLTLLDSQQRIIAAQEKIMLSPVVLGLKKSKAQALGWTENTKITWADIAQAAESGKLKFGMTNPAASNSGFSTLIGVAGAFSGAAADVDYSKLDKNRMQAFFKGQALASGSSGWLADAYIKEQDRLDGLFNYESVLLQLNRDGALKEDLMLIYPQEGIVTADYPVLLLDKNKRETYTKLVECLRAEDLQQALMKETQRRPVNLQVKKSPIFPNKILIEAAFPGNLKQVDQLLFNYLNEHRRPTHAYFVLDNSGSMGGPRIEKLQQALRRLTGEDASISGQFARFAERENITFIRFDHRVFKPRSYLIDPKIGSEKVLNDIRDYVNNMRTDGGTAIYQALNIALDRLLKQREQSPDRYYSIVLLTDGDNTSGPNIDWFRKQYQKRIRSDDSPVRIFPILFGKSNATEMKQLAELSGGRVFDSRKTDLARIMKKIRGYQ